jgi:cell division protein FtsN
MTRDYKPASRKRAPSSGSGSSMLVGILIGLLLGLGIALAVAIYLNRIPGPFLSRGRPAEPAAPAKAPVEKPATAAKAPETSVKPEEKRRFDFYEILPGTDTPAKSKGTETARAQPGETKETFYLQAGAFHALAEADNMKARLALLGIEASIQSNQSTDRGVLHRVRIGPFSRVEEVNRARDTLKQNGIDSTLIKGRDAAS